MPGYELFFPPATATLITYRGESWIATARHVLRNHRLQPADLFVPRTLDSLGERLATSLGVTVDAPPGDEDTAWTDLLVMRCADGVPPPETTVEIDRWRLAALRDVRPGEIVRVHGFPRSVQNQMDHHSLTVQVQRFLCDCRFLGPTESRGIYECLVPPDRATGDLAGLSGGAAFVGHVEAGIHEFAGIVTAASGGRLRILDASIVREVIARHYRERRGAWAHAR